MIVRTYGRRSRSFSDGGGGVSSSHDAFDFDADGDVLGSSASQPLPLPPPSQESSSTWEFDEDPPPSPPQPRPEARRRGARRGGGGWELAEPAVLAPTATLMEAEEYGEMMESMDEVSFALDGLRPAAQRRTRRASLHALLGICASAERRRVLRVQGLLQQIIDAILVLDIDDPPCAIAAGALLFVLASDVQDNNLLDSETCVHFLLKLLNPPVKNVVDAKAPSIGSKLLGISKFQMLNGPNKDSDSSSDDILSKVEEILLSCKEIKPLDKDDKRTSRPELCSKWLALLTMEKACLSAVALEETSDMVARIGGNFKETLRQSGGLDSIFSVMVNCHSELEVGPYLCDIFALNMLRQLHYLGIICFAMRLVKDASTTAMELKEGTPLQSAALLLKCFKILENATFLSENNKTHLLRMNRKLSPKCSLPFIGVVINTIELLSGASSDSRAEDESTLLEDCLLASVKVLMNLANDNPSGCEQIASCGGINTMASLIIKHFPSFDFSMNNNNQLKDRVSSGQHVNVNEDLSSSQNMARQVKTKHLRDHELDFLVAILGLLVNLVEKDSLNRVRLANARVSVSTSQNQDSEETQRDVIPLLCSIFLASQGAGETAEAISPDDEESLLQGAREAEMMIVEAYAALVLAFLSTESMKVRGAVTSCLPDNSLKILVPVLEKFVTFHLQLNMMSRETHSSVTEVIERCRLS
nr:unnamed protein product [Digitaria exilis]